MSAAEQLAPFVPNGLHLRGSVDYAAINAVNYSALKHLEKSPLQYRHALANGTPDTASKFRGSVAHILTLEPERVSEFAVFDGDVRRGKAWDEFEAEHAGQVILKKSELAEAICVANAVRSHPVAGPLLIGATIEPVLLWTDAETGERCKGRPDAISPTNVLIDLKSTRDVTPFSFGRDAHRLGYHAQSAFYGDGLEHVIKRPPTAHVIVAVEQRAPHDVVVYTLDDEVIGIGRDAYRRWLGVLLECRASGRWPGLAHESTMPLKLPAWANDGDDLEALGLE